LYAGKSLEFVACMKGPSFFDQKKNETRSRKEERNRNFFEYIKAKEPRQVKTHFKIQVGSALNCCLKVHWTSFVLKKTPFKQLSQRSKYFF
jgi:hypothetical protein